MNIETDGVRQRLIHTASQVLKLHGGLLPASLLGDELRRHYPALWKDWKSHGDTSSGGLLRLLETCAAGFSVERPEQARERGRVHQPHERSEECQEPLVRLVCEAQGPECTVKVNLSEHSEFHESVRKAMADRFVKHPEGSKGGSVPVAWLTIACEKELLRHIRYFPQYEQDMSQTSPHLAYLFEGMLPGTVTSQTPKALRKTRMACRLIALMAEAPGTFQLNSQPNTETAKDFLCDLITLKQSGMPKACNNPLDTLSSLTMRPNAIGEGRRAWRRALPSEMPRNASELTSKICRLPQADVWVLLLRCQGTRSKEAQLMVLEFQAAATGLGVCASSLHEVAVGMFALEVSGQAEAKFLQLARHLTSVRRPPIRLYRPEAFPTAEALAQYVPEILTQMKAESWWLEVELRETPTNHASLPLKHCPGAVLALKVTAHVANVASHTVEKLQECEERGENHLHLVALEANGGALLLGQEVPVELNQDELQLRPCGLPLAWHQSWQSRPFHFSAGLDSWVANAVVSLAAMESQQCSGFVPINFLDPCCGSGTLAAVAAASGAFTRVLARDVDAKFVERAKENFASADAQSRCRLIDINVHDGSTSFGEIQADVIVVNPPWGWRIGSSIASEKIILNLCHEFPNAVVAVICPEIPLSELVDAHFEIRWSCPLGQSPVWILVPTRPS